MSCPPHHPWLNNFNNIRWRKQAVNLIIMQFSPRPVFFTFGSKYPPQHSFLKNPQSVFLSESERPSFRPIQHNWQNYRFVYFNLQAFRYEMGRQNVLDWIIASIPRILSTSDFIMIVILICYCRLQVFEFATFSNDSLAVLIFWFCHEFGWRDRIIYFVFSAFISRPIFLLASKSISGFSFIVFSLSPSKLI
jgi:hypothetical protein